MALFFISLGISDAQEVRVKPSSNNTGSRLAQEDMTSSDGFTVREEGAVIEGLFIDGTLRISANNVTIRDCIIESGGFYGINITSGNTGLLVEHCEIRGMKSAAILGGNFTARYCHVWDSGADGFKPSHNATIESCYIEKLGYIADSHADGIQMVGGSNVIVRYNNFDMAPASGYKNSQCMIIQSNNSPISNVTVERNWINGGGFSLQFRDRNYGPPTNIIIAHNLFGRDNQFGPWQIDTPDNEALIACNVWEDDGSLLPNQDSSEECNEPIVTPGQAISPTFSLVEGAYWFPPTLVLSSETEDASIYYTADASQPNAESTLYEAPLLIESSQTINAITIANELEDSQIESVTYEVGNMVSVEDWKNMALPATQQNRFSLSFTVTPTIETIDCIVGLSPDSADAYSDCAMICRFNSGGAIDVRNGASYQAETQVMTEAGRGYTFDVEVDVPTRTYSV